MKKQLLVKNLYDTSYVNMVSMLSNLGLDLKLSYLNKLIESTCRNELMM